MCAAMISGWVPISTTALVRSLFALEFLRTSAALLLELKPSKTPPESDPASLHDCQHALVLTVNSATPQQPSWSLSLARTANDTLQPELATDGKSECTVALEGTPFHSNTATWWCRLQALHVKQSFGAADYGIDERGAVPMEAPTIPWESKSNGQHHEAAT